MKVKGIRRKCDCDHVDSKGTNGDTSSQTHGETSEMKANKKRKVVQIQSEINGDDKCSKTLEIPGTVQFLFAMILELKKC